MCCSSAQWKRENVPDHKFDFIDVSQFHSSGCGTRLQYGWLWALFIKSIAVYVADIYTLVALLASNRWSASVLQSSAAKSDTTSSNVLEVPFSIGKWIFFGCIIFSFLLLLWEARKARAIIKSRDISYAFTNVMSQNWYALRSYDHFCFFCQIDNSKKKKDEFAFFIFFTFKGWKRLLFADAPRQVINAITLYSFGKSENFTTNLSVYFSGGILKDGVIVTMVFTVVVWIGSALLLLIAAIMYVPLLCYIQGNLKEYCCHKVDKRIAELMKRKNRKRLAKEAEIARKEARGDFSHLKDKTGKFTAAPLPQPTLPKVGLADNDLYSDAGSIRGGGGGAYQYPPTVPYAQHYGAPSALGARNAYPYASSDSESLAGGKLSHNPSYAESVTSLDAFANRGAPFGQSDSSTSLVGPDGRPMLNAMSRAPSYHTMPSHEGGFGGSIEYDEKYGAYGGFPAELEFDRAGTPKPSSPSLQHSPSQSFRAGAGAGAGAGDYAVPPSRQQQLYERTAQRRQDSVESGGPWPSARAMSWEAAQQGSTGYGGWEETYLPPAGRYAHGHGDEPEELRGAFRGGSTPGPPPRPLPSQDDGNVAGRSAGSWQPHGPGGPQGYW
ncbi:hypothetical protein JCM21900_004349 [Sporobolomyces salmonicolor]